MKINQYNLDSYSALLFDLDGTLIDSMPFHNKAWTEAFKEFGVEITPEFLHETMGMESKRIVGIINERFSLELDSTAVARLKRNKYLETLHEVQVVPELLDILKHYHGKKPMGIVTGSSHEVVDQLLPKIKIDHFFETVVCSDDTAQGKDTEAPYMLASSKLGTTPNQCLFFDDGDVGLKGAKLCQMDAIHVDITKTEVFQK